MRAKPPEASKTNDRSRGGPAAISYRDAGINRAALVAFCAPLNHAALIPGSQPIYGAGLKSATCNLADAKWRFLLRAIKLQSADAKSIFSLARPPSQRHKNRNRSRAACRFFVNYFCRVRRVISREFILRLPAPERA